MGHSVMLGPRVSQCDVGSVCVSVILDLCRSQCNVKSVCVAV